MALETLHRAGKQSLKARKLQRFCPGYASRYRALAILTQMSMAHTNALSRLLLEHDARTTPRSVYNSRDLLTEALLNSTAVKVMLALVVGPSIAVLSKHLVGFTRFRAGRDRGVRFFGGRGGKFSDPACYHCGQTGHFQSACPQKPCLLVRSVIIATWSQGQYVSHECCWRARAYTGTSGRKQQSPSAERRPRTTSWSATQLRS